MRYILLLRGINVGGKHTVNMAVLKAQLREAGMKNPQSYINSGNLLFDTEADTLSVKAEIKKLLQNNYAFPIPFVLLAAADYIAEANALPAWWQENPARRDVLFYSDEVDRPAMLEAIQTMPLQQEVIHIGRLAVFWGKYDESEYLKTAYHKLLLKQPFYKQITIRNGNTFDKLAHMAEE